MSEFTRGPWVINYGDVSDADEGFGIGSKNDPGFGVIAECWPCTTDLEKRKTMRANARLIASAPEMLQALRDLLVAADEAGLDTDNSRTFKKCFELCVRLGG